MFLRRFLLRGFRRLNARRRWLLFAQISETAHGVHWRMRDGERLYLGMAIRMQN